ncbi:MAG: hypothetical protein GYB66_16030 [Chloroflexi bacterium]|nr:hypothetical protein [Chloroflexota bacterium]
MDDAVDSIKEQSILISSGAADGPFAVQLATDLREIGFPAYVSTEVNNLKACDTLVLVISPEALSEKTWQRPYELFLSQGKFICSVRLNGVQLPPQLDALEWVDFSLGYQVGVNGLRSAFANKPAAVSSQVPEQLAISSRIIVISMVLAVVLLVIGLIVAIIVLEAV